MSEKKQYVATGAFVIGAMLIATVTLLYLLGSGLGKKQKFVMVFSGAAKGLNVGAPVALRGVSIGQVTDVDVVLDTKDISAFVMVEAEIDEQNIHYLGDPSAVNTQDLINRGLRAQLNMQSLVTGMLYIELDFHPDSKIVLANIDSPLPQFPTIPTNLERLASKLENFDISGLSEKLERIGDGINSLIEGEDFKKLPSNMNSTLESLRELSDQLQVQVARSGPRLDSVLEEASSGIGNANTELTVAIEGFQKNMENLNNLMSSDSATLYQLNNALQEVSLASRALRQLANTLEQQPEALLRGKRGEQ